MLYNYSQFTSGQVLGKWSTEFGSKWGQKIQVCQLWLWCDALLRSRNCIGLVLHKKWEATIHFLVNFYLNLAVHVLYIHSYSYRTSPISISFFTLVLDSSYISVRWDSKLCTLPLPYMFRIKYLYRYPAARVFAYGTFLFDPSLSQNIPTAHDGTPYAELSFNLSRKKFVTDQKMLNAIRDLLILPSSIHAPKLRER